MPVVKGVVTTAATRLPFDAWGVHPGVGVLIDPLKICRRSQSMFWPTHPQKVTFFHLKLLLDNSARFTLSRMKDFCQKFKKMEGKSNFRGANWLPETGTVERLEISYVDVIWNSLMAWPLISTTYFMIDLRHWYDGRGTSAAVESHPSRSCITPA